MTVLFILFGTAIFCLIVVAIAQLILIRMSLRDAPQPYWDDIYQALWKLHGTTWLSWMTAPATMWLGARLWPPKELE